MRHPLIQLNLSEFEELLSRYEFIRRISAVHLHHTQRPGVSQYRGLQTLENMCRFHTDELRFSDIAQHITVAPDGSIWTGRPWNHMPASAAGHNGTADNGPFMIEMIGNFDRSCDALEGIQRQVVLAAIVAIQRRFGRSKAPLVFHRQMNPERTCPGSEIDYNEIVAEVENLHRVPRSYSLQLDSSDDAPIDASKRISSGNVREHVLRKAVNALFSEAPELPALEDEPPETLQDTPLGSFASARSRSRGLGPQQRRDLRRHVIRMRNGQLSAEGEFFSSPSDVYDLFSIHLARAYEDAASYTRPLRLLLYAQSGLLSEQSSLQYASSVIPWWLQNGIYPVFLLWEANFLETMRELLRGVQSRLESSGLRQVSDAAIERIGSELGRTAWSGLKRNAELCSETEGGGFLFAQLLTTFCSDRNVELHAACHSAGTLFHASFLPLIAETIEIRSLHLLAPAISTHDFRRLQSLMGAGINYTTIYTMSREFELGDRGPGGYRKSLLYLIHRGLEMHTPTPVLGLDVSLSSEMELRRLFGADGHESKLGEVLLSKTPAGTGRYASLSTSHGGFENDSATMNCVALRVLGLKGDSDLEASFPSLDYTEYETEDIVYSVLREFSVEAPLPAAIPAVGTGQSPAVVSPSVSSPGQRGRRLALCVGINSYVRSPLTGCIADAQRWKRVLEQLGFSASILPEHAATYTGLKQSFSDFVASGRTGDTLVFQYSGHGTQIPDLDPDSESDEQDEAICPIDFDVAQVLADDEIGNVIDQVQPGVNLTLFIDCCHSGDVSRFALGRSVRPRSDSIHPRFIKLSVDEIQRYRQARSGLHIRRREGGRSKQEILFSACRASEIAFERDGQGDFTRHATSVLESAGDTLTNVAFLERILASFGRSPQQHPELTCVTKLRAAGIFASVARSV